MTLCMIVFKLNSFILCTENFKLQRTMFLEDRLFMNIQ